MSMKLSKTKLEEIKEHAADLAAEVRKTEKYPEAPVIRKGEHTWTILCPYCQQKHAHGPGDGYREPHCYIVAGMPAYCVVDKLEDDGIEM